MTIEAVQAELDDALRIAGCQEYTAMDARLDMQELWQVMLNDDIANGKPGGGPFFTYALADDVCLFTLFNRSVAIYVVRGEETDFRFYFDDLATSDVKSAKRLLSEVFGRPSPDVLIDLPLSFEWLGATGSSGAN